MVISSRQSGLVATCSCGSKQFIPSQSANRTGLLYCPCGHIEKIGKDVFNKIQSRSFRAKAAQSGIRSARLTPAVMPKQTQLRRQLEIDFVEIG